MRAFRLASIGAAASLLPGFAHAQDKLTPVGVFQDAALPMQVIMLLLIAASIAAIVVAVRKVMSGPNLAGGSTFLQALRLGGPLIGLLGAAYNLFLVNLAIANIGEQPAYPVLAPGVAEAAFLFLLGLIAGVVAVICNWVVEARIDRTVLRA
jgi:biopolymer transport protein ExbB/TolQ